MTTATVTSKGQVTVPKEVRDFLGANEGDRLEFTMEEGRTVRVRRVGRSVKELAGILYRPGMEPVSLEEMRQSMIDYLEEEDERIRLGLPREP